MDAERVVCLRNHVMQSKLSGLLHESGPRTVDTEMEALASCYQSFLQDSNAVDLADVCMAVQRACDLDIKLGLKHELTTANFVIINPRFNCTVEVSVT